MPKSTSKRPNGWQRGVSSGAAGRLGAQAAGIEPAENGYLTYQTDGPTFMLIGPDRTAIGSLQLPPRYSVCEKTHSWTLRQTRYRAPAQAGCEPVNLQALGSVVSPAATFASAADRLFRWRWPVKGSPQWCAFPTRGGLTVAHYARGWPLRALDVTSAYLFEAGRYEAPTEPAPGRLPWDAPWLVTFDPRGQRNVPVLWVFGGRRPTRIAVTSYENMDFVFARPYGRIMAMPLFGSARIDRDLLGRFRNGHDLKRLRAWGDFWAGALRKLPDTIDDYFRIDDAAGEMSVRMVGRRLDGRRPTVCPVPPFLAAAAGTAYPIAIGNKPLPAPALSPGRPAGLYTHYGPYTVVAGGELRYTMPLCPYLDRVLSPVRVTGDRRAANLTRRLRAYFDDPKYTYGGDGTYDPDSLLDILHNLRVLAWAGWSLPDEQRPAAHAAIVRNFDRLFRPGSYRYYREPSTGRTFCRDPKIFDWCGDVSYDIDWYSGMNLTGLWAGVHFGALPDAWVRRRWKLVRDIAAYFEIFQDWATMVPWTDMRGELLNIDCARHGAQGMIGFARLAERFGTPRQRDLARYIASRYMVFWAAEHVLPDLYAAGGVPMATWGRGGGEMVLGFGGVHERDDGPAAFGSGAKNPYTLSPLNPEHMLFLRDYGPTDRLQHYEAEVLDREVPGWDTRPADVYFARQPKASIERNAGAYHFYMLDPHLFCRMLVLDWPSRKALKRVKELSGQVIAAALVADAPKVIAPASVAFGGTMWDAAAKVLTIRAEAASKTRATWEVLWPTAPKRVAGPARAKRRFAKGRLTLVAEVSGPVQWRLEYA